MQKTSSKMAQEDRLPALNALRAFEAAARHLSFTRAAEELNVTRAPFPSRSASSKSSPAPLFSAARAARSC